MAEDEVEAATDPTHAVPITEHMIGTTVEITKTFRIIDHNEEYAVAVEVAKHTDVEVEALEEETSSMEVDINVSKIIKIIIVD